MKKKRNVQNRPDRAVLYISFLLFSKKQETLFADIFDTHDASILVDFYDFKGKSIVSLYSPSCMTGHQVFEENFFEAVSNENSEHRVRIFNLAFK